MWQWTWWSKYESQFGEHLLLHVSVNTCSTCTLVQWHTFQLTRERKQRHTHTRQTTWQPTPQLIPDDKGRRNFIFSNGCLRHTQSAAWVTQRQPPRLLSNSAAAACRQRKHTTCQLVEPGLILSCPCLLLIQTWLWNSMKEETGGQEMEDIKSANIGLSERALLVGRPRR